MDDYKDDPQISNEQKIKNSEEKHVHAEEDSEYHEYIQESFKEFDDLMYALYQAHENQDMPTELELIKKVRNYIVNEERPLPKEKIYNSDLYDKLAEFWRVINLDGKCDIIILILAMINNNVDFTQHFYNSPLLLLVINDFVQQRENADEHYAYFEAFLPLFAELVQYDEEPTEYLINKDVLDTVILFDQNNSFEDEFEKIVLRFYFGILKTAPQAEITNLPTCVERITSRFNIEISPDESIALCAEALSNAIKRDHCFAGQLVQGDAISELVNAIKFAWESSNVSKVVSAMTLLRNIALIDEDLIIESLQEQCPLDLIIQLSGADEPKVSKIGISILSIFTSNQVFTVEHYIECGLPDLIEYLLTEGYSTSKSQGFYFMNNIAQDASHEEVLQLFSPQALSELAELCSTITGDEQFPYIAALEVILKNVIVATESEEAIEIFQTEEMCDFLESFATNEAKNDNERMTATRLGSLLGFLSED